MHQKTYGVMQALWGFYSLQKKHRRFIIGGALGLTASVSLFFGYRWYSFARESEAQKHFIKCVEDFHSVFVQGGNWARVAVSCEQGAFMNKGTYWEPYFYAYQAQALVNDGKLNAAIDALDMTLSLMPYRSPARSAYAIMHALMTLDSVDSTRHEAALQALRKIAHNSSDIASDEALFYLGYYYWQHDKSSEAYGEWQALVKRDQDDRTSSSPWAGLAEPLLEQITVS